MSEFSLADLISKSKEKVGNSKSLDPMGTGYSYMAGADFPRDVTLLQTFSNVFDESGKKIDVKDGLYNHHNVFFDFSASAPTMVGCEGKAAVGKTITTSIFMAGATEEGNTRFTSVDGKFNSGFYLGKDDKINMGIDVVNYNNVSRTVYVEADMEYVPGQMKDALPSAQQVINLGMCSGFNGVDIHPPPGQKKFKLEGSDIVIARDGWMVSTGGHLHG